MYTPKESSDSEVTRLRNEMSLKLLQALDEDIDEVLHQVSFVSAYKMSLSQSWERADIEGFLYLINRKSQPQFSFILINRKSEYHLVEHVTGDTELSIDGQFIFYRNGSPDDPGSLKGLWFKTPEECASTYKVLESMIKTWNASNLTTPTAVAPDGGQPPPTSSAAKKMLYGFPRKKSSERMLYLLDPSLVQQGDNDEQSVTIKYKDLRRAIASVLQSNDFAAMVWEKLRHPND